MTFYFAAYWVINNMMIDYIPVLSYLYILFPIVIAQSKIQLVLSTYYKVLREEKAMLRANLSSVILFLFIAIPMFMIFNNVLSIVISTLLTLLWRCYASEVYLKKKMGIDSYQNIIVEVLMIVAFIAINILWSNQQALFAYLLILIIYLISQRKKIKLLIIMIKGSLGPEE
jgi:hypothetical protein